MKPEAWTRIGVICLFTAGLFVMAMVGLPTKYGLQGDTAVSGCQGCTAWDRPLVLLGGNLMSGVLLIAGLTSTKGAFTIICYYTGGFLLGYETYVFSMSAVA